MSTIQIILGLIDRNKAEFVCEVCVCCCFFFLIG